MVGPAGHPKSRWRSAGRGLPAVVVVIAAGCSSSAGHSTAPTTTSLSTTATAATTLTPVSLALTPIASSPSCDRATKDGTADALLSAFRAARVRGSGAEHCLTAQALGAYCTTSHRCSQEFQASPGPICLYECAGYKVKDVNFEVTRAADGNFSVYVAVQAQPSSPSATSPRGYPASAYEHLTLGRGVPVGSSTRAQLVIVDATPSA